MKDSEAGQRSSVSSRWPEESYDVAILGGGLAGLSLGLQLKGARPETSIFIAERRKGPAPEAAFKVGESTVEMSARYFSETLGLKDHLETEQLEKAGLRFFFPAGDNSDISQRVEWGAKALLPVKAYQLDRGRFENELAERNVAAGNDLFDDCRVEEVELGDESHTVSYSRAGEPGTVTARWVVDASGWAGLLKKKLGLEKEVEHTINSAWFRLAGGLDIDTWVDDPAWHDRMEQPGVRKLSTNHLMGQGYWVWLIPLSSGPISIGIVADPRFHPYEEISTLDAALAWLKRHEPQLGAEVERRRDQVEDFLRVEDFAYGCTRVFSPDRWALTGIAGVFLDPFYSPGSDFIAQGNTFITDLILRDFAGEAILRRALQLDAAFLGRFETALRGTYTNCYKLFGNARVMTAKLLWEFALYWATVALPFFNDKMQDLDFAAATADEFKRVFAVSSRMEHLFRDWHELDQGEWRSAFIANSSFPGLWRLHTDLQTPLDEEALKAKYVENAELLEALAIVLFSKAAERLPNGSIDAEAKINPAAISLKPDQWEKDGLLAPGGMTVAEARAIVPGVERMLLDEIAQPV